MGYPTGVFHKNVHDSIRSKIKRFSDKLKLTDEQCRAVAHHMKYNILAGGGFDFNSHYIIPFENMEADIVKQIDLYLHENDIPRYVEQYHNYLKIKQNWSLTLSEKIDFIDIATGRKKVSDFANKGYLKNLYVKYFNQIVLPTIIRNKISKQENLQYHGIRHTEQVALIAIDISVEEGINPFHSLLAAALHDCARTRDGEEHEHAKNCEPIARKFLTDTAIYKDATLLNDQARRQIIHAVVNHNTPVKDKSNPILNCLQDADSMRLWWERRAHYSANTPRGKKLSQYSHREQIRYMAHQLERLLGLQSKENRTLIMQSGRPRNYSPNYKRFDNGRL